MQVNCKYGPNIISYGKISNFLNDFRLILSYKRAQYVTIALNGKILSNIQDNMKIIIFLVTKF